jgi:hypothetical protein
MFKAAPQYPPVNDKDREQLHQISCQLSHRAAARDKTIFRCRHRAHGPGTSTIAATKEIFEGNIE